MTEQNAYLEYLFKCINDFLNLTIVTVVDLLLSVDMGETVSHCVCKSQMFVVCKTFVKHFIEHNFLHSAHDLFILSAENCQDLIRTIAKIMLQFSTKLNDLPVD